MSEKNQTLVESFKKYFTVDFAHTPLIKSKVYAIRYHVYCDEFHYESPDRFPDKQEYDEFDDQSLHCLITHKMTGLPAGCVRLVPTTGNKGEALLPFEKYCSESLDHEFIKSLNLDRETICEISRLAVDSTFRRRSGEALTRFGDAMNFSDHEKRTFSLIAVSCFLAATALTDMTGRSIIFAMMEPFLPRLLKKSGIIFQQVGKSIDYHGIRAPYYIKKTQSAMNKMDPELKILYQWIYEQIEETYWTSI
ncbi:MAG: PEP-CTERM/exosortase system-associated acyltransferase [Methylobacter sp.]|uniref:PEP-CTERM/exosortase system-associated acyltransferase n=1 Tax=Methylobacter sp. TaxID=2051955 RepID=UPI00258F8A6F|nr:PEP-CTERM/exosortase system-associated acyltransferase [Methylobacter sp.]MCL7421364.1 PEP-CTERM/exosortase system-associated acyltransferase [Methylobacter sp.]